MSPRPALARSPCWMLISEDVRVAGELWLDESTLHFSPDPEHAERALKLSLPSVLAAVVTPVKGRLLVQTLDEAVWFDGPNVTVLGRRLQARIHPEADAPDAEEERFDGDEPLLVCGPARWGWVTGELQLTDRRLRFRANTGGRLLAGAMGISSHWDVRLEEIVRDPARGLKVHAGTRGLWLRGTAATAARLFLEEPSLELAWPAQLRLSRVFVALTASRLLVAPIQGGARLESALTHLQRMQVRGEKLTLDSPDLPGPVVLKLSAAGLLLDRIARRVVMGSQPRSVVEDVQRIETAAIWWRERGFAELGGLCLESGQVSFHPTRSDEPPVLIPQTAMERQDAPSHRIRIHTEGDGQTYLFEPSGGEKFVEQFWQRSLPPERTQSWPTTAEDRERLLQGIRSVWLSDRARFELALYPGMLLDHESGFGVVLPETVTPPPNGTTLTVEVGRPDGIYQFDAQLLRVAPLPPEIRIPRTGKVFVLRPPKSLRFYNQRSAFRIALRMPVNAWRLRLDPRRNTWVPDGDRLNGHLIDLSVSGCQLHTDAEIQTGEHLFLELLIEEHWLPLEAECVRLTPGWPTGQQLGLRFLNLPDRLEQMLSRTILERQRGKV
ncbi:MAG: PilZ domain-containing protein [Myxococcota bacterium]